MSPLPHRTLAQPGNTDDEGAADPVLTEALATYAVDGAENPVLCLLGDARLLVPVVATGAGDAEISAVLMRGRDGRLALLAFTGIDSLRRWDPAARPVPVSGGDAARAATAQDARALLVDVAGPVPFVVETAEVGELAAGHHLMLTSVGYGWFAAG